MSTTRKGKRAEFRVIDLLLKSGFDLYIPVIDTGVDLIAERRENNIPGYFPLQVRA